MRGSRVPVLSSLRMHCPGTACERHTPSPRRPTPPTPPLEAHLAAGSDSSTNTVPSTQGGCACSPRCPTEPCTSRLVVPGQFPLLDKGPQGVGGGLDPGKGPGPLRTATARGLAEAVASSRRRAGAGWRSGPTGHFEGEKTGQRGR